MNLILRGFFRCECGKIHTYDFISRNTICKCGMDLWSFLWGFDERAK